MIEGAGNLCGSSESHSLTFTEESVRRYLFVRTGSPMGEKCSAALHYSVVPHYTLYFKLKGCG